ncbi:hypothetical protein V4F39_25235 [Aquincola sp. MAHUQ-54]|uniref:Uncharacterized protein n=1 Tax=Aquincola agrisoli TaxID=3119538 RepID=A0AAW9QQK8_9BURK
MKRIASLSLLAMAAAGSAVGKLPEPSPEAKAKAAETAARTAWSGKVADYQLCQSMDKVAAAYHAQAKAAGKDVQPVATPACVDPGAFSYTPPEAKPIEAAGAHSPPQTATSPPSTTEPAASAPKR